MSGFRNENVHNGSGEVSLRPLPAIRPTYSPRGTKTSAVAIQPPAELSNQASFKADQRISSPLTSRLMEARSLDTPPTEIVANRPTISTGKRSSAILAAYDEEAGKSLEGRIESQVFDSSSEESLPLEDDGSIEEKEPAAAAPTTTQINADQLSLSDVLASVAACYPEIEIAIGEIEESRGKVLASWGEFDSIFSAHSISQPLGFYQTYRNGAGVSRPLYGGGEVYGTYRIGDGNFEPWYGERETNEGGELKAGFSLPLLKDRAIDKRRAGLRAAELNRDQVEANVDARLLQFERFATQAYWDWVASGQALLIQTKLLELAEQRVEQISARIEQGDLAKISEIDNDRFIAKRKNGLIKARRGIEKAAIKLSLFLRDENCCPVIVEDRRLPVDFPSAARIAEEMIADVLCRTLRTRPELRELAAAREEACVKLEYAQNLLLPKLDLKGFAGQDLGGETSSKGDKTPFELQLGVFADVPLQRREGAGKIQAAQGKITQIDAKRQLVTDKIRAEVQDAASAVNAAYEQILQSRENVRLNEQALELGLLAFEEGDIDLLALNIYESSVADARLQLLEAQHKYFYSLVIYRTITSSEAFVDR